MEPIPPLYTADLFPPLHRELIALLSGLDPEDWERPTVAGEWRVRDVAAHLLDVDLRKLAVCRDGYVPRPDEPIDSYRDLVRFLDGLNSRWVHAARRLSPRLLVELLSFSGPLVADLVASLAPHEPALFSVAWAGEEVSENWFDVGRDYTERWHHQMQIRDAVGAPGLLARRWLFPLLDLSLRALPRVYQTVPAPDQSSLLVRVTGDGGGSWSLVRSPEGWDLFRGEATSPTATVVLEPDTAWRLLYNGLSGLDARSVARVHGDVSLAEPLFSARSVMV